jgi:hypothetical protein
LLLFGLAQCDPINQLPLYQLMMMIILVVVTKIGTSENGVRFARQAISLASNPKEVVLGY